MAIFEAIGCALTGHDWIYRRGFRVCSYCDKLQKY